MIDLTKAKIDKNEFELIKNMTEQDLIHYIYKQYYVERHLSMTKIGEIFGNKSHYYCNQFKKYNLPARDDTQKGKKYTCNENYFEIIDTEDKAYWLGFMYADGYIQSKRKDSSRKIGIALSANDIAHLKTFKECLVATHDIKTYHSKQGYSANTYYCRLLISSEKLAHDLEDKGCFEKKTNILKFPSLEQVPEHLQKHFIRGYFDGDGSIWCGTAKDSKIPTYTIDFCGTDDLLTGIMNVLINEGVIKHNYKLNKRLPGQTVSYFAFGGNLQTCAFCEYIYQGATVYLQRKYDKYLNLKETLNLAKRINKCCVCGTTESSEFNIWLHGGEYDGKILCQRHYLQMRRHGEIIRVDKMPQKTNKCDICGDINDLRYHAWIHDDEYFGKTLCIKHYTQLHQFGHVVDNSPAKHKKIC